MEEDQIEWKREGKRSVEEVRGEEEKEYRRRGRWRDSRGNNVREEKSEGWQERVRRLRRWEVKEVEER